MEIDICIVVIAEMGHQGYLRDKIVAKGYMTAGLDNHPPVALAKP